MGPKLWKLLEDGAQFYDILPHLVEDTNSKIKASN